MSDPQLHLLLSRIAELTLQIETVRAMCEQRIEAVQPLGAFARISASDVLAVLDGGGSDE
jgi:hypothetical protein